MLLNLLSNAVKFTDGGSVSIVAVASNDQVALSVQDTGRGLSEEDQAHLFEPFQQVPGTVGGTGLGLALSRRLCRVMGGELTVASDRGNGATFTVWLPTAE